MQGTGSGHLRNRRGGSVSTANALPKMGTENHTTVFDCGDEKNREEVVSPATPEETPSHTEPSSAAS